MSDFFETRVKNLEPKEDRKKSSELPKNLKNPSRKGKGKTPTQVLQSPVKNQLELATQLGNTASYTVNAIILQTITRIYMLWSTSTNRKKKLSKITERSTKS